MSHSSLTTPHPSLTTLLGDLITMQFDAELANSAPSTARFRVTVNGVVTSVIAASVSSGEGLAFLTLASAPAPGASVSVTYTDLIGDQSSGVLQLADGSDIASFTQAITNDSADAVAPQLDAANVDGNRLTLSFNESLGSGLPRNSAFSVLVNARPVAVSAVEVIGGQAVLTLAKAVAFGDDVTIGYKDLSGDQPSGVLEDTSGNDLATFANEVVVNDTVDATPLAFAAATVNGDTLEITFDRDIADVVPSARTFRVEANGRVINATRAEVFPDDRQVVLTLATPVTNKETVVVSYIDPAGDQRSGVVEDVQGNDLISFTKKPVKNDTVDLNPISLDTAEVVGGKQLVLTFSKELGTSEPSAARFKVLANGKLQAISSIETSPDDGQVILNLRNSIPSGVKVALDYSDQAGDQSFGVVEDATGKDLATVKSFSVTNFIEDATPPELVDAEVDGRTVTLFFDKELDNSRPNASAFTVTAGRQRFKVRSASIAAGDTVAELQLQSAVPAGVDVVISYKDPKNDQAKGVVQDLAGNDLESIRDFPVANMNDGASKRLFNGTDLGAAASVAELIACSC